MNGKVKWFNNRRGHGFIMGSDGREYFVHYTNILKTGYKVLSENQQVEFTPVEGPKGPKAEEVVPN